MPLLVIDRHPSDSDGHGNVGYIPMAITGYLEQAKLAAQRTFIPGTASAGSGHDGVATTAFLAWSKEASAGRCLDAALAMLVVHVTRRDPPPALRPLIEALRDIAPPVGEDRLLGPELAGVTSWFTRQVFAAAGG